jgi:hypothetical protein
VLILIGSGLIFKVLVIIDDKNLKVWNSFLLCELMKKLLNFCGFGNFDFVFLRVVENVKDDI